MQVRCSLLVLSKIDYIVAILRKQINILDCKAGFLDSNEPPLSTILSVYICMYELCIFYLDWAMDFIGTT